MPRRDSLEDDLTEAAMLRAGEEIIRCPKCHKAIFDGVPSCTSCGTQFGKLKPRRTLAVITVLIILALVLGLLFFP